MAMHDVPAPLFDTVDIQGKPQRLADYRGQVVLVNIWATWCEPCRTEMPQLDKLYRARKTDGLVVLGISDEAIDQQQAFLSQVPIAYPLLITTPGVPAFYRRDSQVSGDFSDRPQRKSKARAQPESGIRAVGGSCSSPAHRRQMKEQFHRRVAQRRLVERACQWHARRVYPETMPVAGVERESRHNLAQRGSAG